jgi:hypothetical protein
MMLRVRGVSGEKALAESQLLTVSPVLERARRLPRCARLARSLAARCPCPSSFFRPVKNKSLTF